MGDENPETTLTLLEYNLTLLKHCRSPSTTEEGLTSFIWEKRSHKGRSHKGRSHKEMEDT